MDLRKCAVCDTEFDFDETGLQGPKVVVCRTECAKKSAGSRGNKYAIHDDSGGIIDTDIQSGEKNLTHVW